MKKSNFALRLQPALLEEVRKLAKAEGVAVNQLINVAVAEKLSALRTEQYFAERAARGDRPGGAPHPRAGRRRPAAHAGRRGAVARGATRLHGPRRRHASSSPRRTVTACPDSRTLSPATTTLTTPPRADACHAVNASRPSRPRQ